MLFIGSILKNVDNSGIILTKIIHIYKGTKRDSAAKIKDRVLISSQKIDYRKFQNKKMTTAIVAKIKKHIRRKNGHFLKFKKAGVIVLYENDAFKGTIIKGPLAAELRFQNVKEIVTTARAMI